MGDEPRGLGIQETPAQVIRQRGSHTVNRRPRLGQQRVVALDSEQRGRHSQEQRRIADQPGALNGSVQPRDRLFCLAEPGQRLGLGLQAQDFILGATTLPGPGQTVLGATEGFVIGPWASLSSACA
jgi:hypothetical protein